MHTCSNLWVVRAWTSSSWASFAPFPLFCTSFLLLVYKPQFKIKITRKQNIINQRILKISTLQKIIIIKKNEGKEGKNRKGRGEEEEEGEKQREGVVYKFLTNKFISKRTFEDGSDKNSSASRPYCFNNSFLSSLVNPAPDSISTKNRITSQNSLLD